MFEALSSDISKSQTTRKLRVLLVEDHFLTAYQMTVALRRIGCEVVGPVSTFTHARELVERDDFDAAVLDIDIIGGSGFDLAPILIEKGLPFAFVSGHCCQKPWPKDFEHVPCLTKPVNLVHLRRVIGTQFHRPPSAGESNL